MKKKVLLLFLGLSLLCSACRAQPPRHRVVCRILVIRQGQSAIYSTPHKMSEILNAMRSLGQRTRAQIDPDTLSVPGCRIILERTDGSSMEYRIKGERYIRRGHEPWQQTDPQALSELTDLLGQLPPDG